MINDPAQITRVILGNVPPWLAIAFYATVATAVAWATYKFVMKFLRYRQGRARTESGEPFPRLSVARSNRIGGAFADLSSRIASRPLCRYRPHPRILWLCHSVLGNLYGLPGTRYAPAFLLRKLLSGRVFDHRRRRPGLSRRFGDVPLSASDRQNIAHHPRADVLIFTWLLVAIGVTGFLLESARIAVDRPAFERWSVVGYALADGLSASGFSGDAALRLHRFLWGGHAILCVTLFAMLPWQFFSHLVFGPVAWGLKTNRLRSTLRASLDDTAAAVQGPVPSTGVNFPGSICYRPTPVQRAAVAMPFARPMPPTNHYVRGTSSWGFAMPWIMTIPVSRGSNRRPSGRAPPVGPVTKPVQSASKCTTRSSKCDEARSNQETSPGPPRDDWTA